MIIDGQGERLRNLTFIFEMVQRIEWNAMFKQPIPRQRLRGRSSCRDKDQPIASLEMFHGCSRAGRDGQRGDTRLVKIVENLL